MLNSLCLPWERVDERSPLALQIAAATARDIIELRIPSGEFLTEAGLAAAAEASRTPAREAMLQLEAWSLVRLLPKKGAIVTSVTAKERQDMLALRAMLEIDAVESIVRGITDLDLLQDSLETALQRQRTALVKGQSLEFASADYTFHASIILHGGNTVVAGLLETLAPRIARLTYLAITEAPDRLPRLMTEHEELAKHALAGDVPNYTKLIRTHISAGHSTVLAGN